MLVQFAATDLSLLLVQNSKQYLNAEQRIIQPQLSEIGLELLYAKPGRQWRPLELVVLMVIIVT